MNIKNNLVKATAAAALTITGIAGINAVKPATASHVQAATTRVRVNYVAGYGVNIWNNYTHRHFTGKRAMHGATYNVLATATDGKGNLWYEIGQNQWISAKYTVKVSSTRTAVKKAAIKSTVKTSKKSVQASSNASAVIALARSEAGKRYVWGATGPNSFDCSGLVQYVYKKAAGISLPRTTYSQVNAGKAVSLKNLQPGDLLFWGSTRAPYHVGIYLGNGQYIHAATPSQGVIIQTVSSYFMPSTARRVLV